VGWLWSTSSSSSQSRSALRRALPTEEELLATYRQLTGHLHLVPGTAIAEEMGNPRAANVVLLGALSTFLELDSERWLAVIETRVPPIHVALNRRAFLRGRETTAH